MGASEHDVIVFLVDVGIILDFVFVMAYLRPSMMTYLAVA